jgi:hypothetical protein
MRIVSNFLAVAITSSTALAQQSVPPPPQPPSNEPAAQSQPAENGPSLEVTMKFIQDKVNQEGQISYTITSTNNLTGQTYNPFGLTDESQVVAADPACGLSFKTTSEKTIQHTTGTYVTTWRLNFKDVGKLEVMTSAEDGRTRQQGWSYQEDPPFYVLYLHLSNGKKIQQHFQLTMNGKRGKTKEWDTNDEKVGLEFRDGETAGRVAKAMIHAVELCGVSKPEPF